MSDWDEIWPALKSALDLSRKRAETTSQIDIEMALQMRSMIGNLAKICSKQLTESDWAIVEPFWIEAHGLAERLSRRIEIVTAQESRGELWFFQENGSREDLVFLREHMRRLDSGSKQWSDLREVVLNLSNRLEFDEAFQELSNSNREQTRCTEAAERLWELGLRMRAAEGVLPTLTSCCERRVSERHQRLLEEFCKNSDRHCKYLTAKALAAWSGEQATELVCTLFSEAKSDSERAICLSALAEIGGCGVTEFLCQNFDNWPSLRQFFLVAFERLAGNGPVAHLGSSPELGVKHLQIVEELLAILRRLPRNDSYTEQVTRSVIEYLGPDMSGGFSATA